MIADSVRRSIPDLEKSEFIRDDSLKELSHHIQYESTIVYVFIELMIRVLDFESLFRHGYSDALDERQMLVLNMMMEILECQDRMCLALADLKGKQKNVI